MLEPSMRVEHFFLFLLEILRVQGSVTKYQIRQSILNTEEKKLASDARFGTLVLLAIKKISL